MLDWLNNDQRVSSSDTSHLLDAPDTPAPLFAYRALKSVLFGSHDDEYGDENDKENIPLQTRTNTVSISSEELPSKTNSSIPPRPSPRRMLSPAKSILRTPGIPTPRRQKVSVKFKDVKQTSMSLGTVAKGFVPEHKASLQRAEIPATLSSETKASTGQITEPATNPQFSKFESEPETYYNVKEIDAYIAATEREMKKLVRYGQRMREYARLSQKESVTLKRELDNVKKANEILQHREHLPHIPEKAGHKSENDGLFDLSSSSKHTVKAVTQRGPGHEPTTTQQGLEGQGQRQSCVESAGGMPQKPFSPEFIKSKAGGVSALAKSDLLVPVQRTSAVSFCPADDAKVASRTLLPPDRLAAAKARLRVKSEERRKAVSMTGQVQKEDHDLSVVDWQNL